MTVEVEGGGLPGIASDDGFWVEEGISKRSKYSNSAVSLPEKRVKGSLDEGLAFILLVSR